MADDSFHIQPSDLHNGAAKLESFAADIGASGQKMKSAGDSLVEHASRDKSGVGAVVVKTFGKALSTTGGVFSQASRLTKGSSDRLHSNASAHEETEGHNTDSFRNLHSDSDSGSDRPKTTGSGDGGSTKPSSTGSGEHYTPPTDHPHDVGSSGTGSGTSEHRPDDPATSSTSLDGRCVGGDPVDMVSGEVVMTDTDVSLAGVLSLVLRRTHVSTYRAGRSFGTTWCSTMDQRLVFDDEGVLFLAEDGVILVYPEPGVDAPVLPAAGAAWPLVVDSDGGYRVTDTDSGRTWRFGSRGESTESLLHTIADRNDNTVEVVRDEQDTPVEVRHSGGYRVAVTTTDERLVTELRLLRDGAADVSLVRFGYTDGRLTEVVNSSGLAMRFDYDAVGRVTRWEDRNGFWYGYTYRDDGRCVRGEGSGAFLNATFDYDLAARTTTTTDSTGAVRRFEYNARGQVVRQTDALGNLTVSSWDSRNRLLSRTDAIGATTTYRTDERGNLVAVVYPDGATIIAEYGAADQPVTIADATGAVWRRQYDERGNVVAVVDPLGATTTFEYGDHGELLSTVDALGLATTCRTNAAGLPLSITDPTGATTLYERDAFGRTTATVDAVGGRTQFGWTVEGKLTWRQFADGTGEQRRYDGEGNVVEHVDAAGGHTTFGYTAFDQMIWQREPDGALTTYGYDTELRPIEVTNAEGAVWRYEYDATGILTGEQDFAGRMLRYERDPRGRYTRTVNGMGETTELVHDQLGRLVSRTVGEHVTRMEYDAVGRLVRATTPDAELLFGYDLVGRVVSESTDGRSLANEYDPLGRRTRRTTPAGVTSTWTYDAAGNPRSLDAGGKVIGFEHDPAGRETSRQFGVVTVEQVWEPTHRLRVQAISTRDPRNPNDRPLTQRRSYQYRPDGYLAGIADLAGVREFTMDPVGRVTSATGPAGVERYGYDGIGNITTDTFEYSAGRLRAAGRTRFTHDGNGRVVERRTRTLSGQERIWRYTWDAEDRLREVTTPDGVRWRYGYDAFARRVSKQRLTDDGSVAERVDFTWDGTVLAEQRHVTADWARDTTWDWEPGQARPLTQTEQTRRQDAVDREFYAIITDLIGTPTELVAESGEITERLSTSLWGTTVGTPRVPFRFPGQYHDTESGLHYNVFRYYDPTVGRYYSEDPIGLRGGLNPSGYVPNPTCWADSLGLAKCLASSGTAAAGNNVTTMSGWQMPRPQGIAFVDPQQTINLENQMGFPLKNGGAFDQGTLGKYYASHAERQATQLNPDIPVRVDKPMCQDCQDFFRSLAQHRGTPQMVSDPDVHRIFLPNGTVETTPNPLGVNLGTIV